MVNDAQMDSTDFGVIVVEQGHNTVTVADLDRHFLCNFALHRGEVDVVKIRIEQRHFVRRVDMSADADRSATDEPRLARGFPADVTEYLTIATDDDVGNELLEVGIRFRLRTNHESGNTRGEQSREVSLHVEGNPLKHSRLFDDASFDDQYFLQRIHHRVSSLVTCNW